MIVDCDVYVVNQGFIPVADVCPGDKVFSLNAGKPEIIPVDRVYSEFINKPIDRIRTGIQQSDATEDTRYLYWSEDNGYRYIAFNKIEEMTPNKEYQPNKYLPVLGGPLFTGQRNFTDSEIESVVRKMAMSHPQSGRELSTLAELASGEDAFIFIDLIEHWMSHHPGLGKFGKLNRKARVFYLYDGSLVDNFRKLAMMAGWCTLAEPLNRGAAVQVVFDSVMIPGDVPKNQKYVRVHYRGNVYGINAKNRPIYGRFGSRAYYLPFASVLNQE